MASIPLTLAALATSAVPGLRVVGTRVHTEIDAELFTAAHLLTDEQELLIRVPNTPHAEVQLSAELLGIAALSEGARESLPCAVPETLGMTRAGDTRAVVSTHLAGDRVSVHDIASDAILVQSLSEVLAAIHQLPVGLVHAQGLPIRSANEVREHAKRLIERVAATHLLPETVHQSWLRALRDDRMWDFDPCVVHGSFAADQLRVSDDVVVGVLGWDALAVADPASDFTWLLEAGQDTSDAVLARYAALRGVAGTQMLRARARFYHQLEVAQWLLHGVDAHDDSVVQDAVGMLDRMVDRLERSSPIVAADQALNSDDVAEILDQVPSELRDPRSETAEYEALDEDRMFEWDLEHPHVEPLTADAVDRATNDVPHATPGSPALTEPADPGARAEGTSRAGDSVTGDAGPVGPDGPHPSASER